MTHLVITEEEAKKSENPKIKEASKLNIEAILDDALQDLVEQETPSYDPSSSFLSGSYDEYQVDGKFDFFWILFIQFIFKKSII